MQCINIHSQFGDKTSSMKIEHKKTGAAKGLWKNVGSATGSYTFEISVGMTSTRETSSSTTITNTLTVEMNEGVIFAGAKMSNTLSTEVMNATRNTFTKTTSTKTSFKCVSPNPKEAIGVWQWVTTSNDGSYSARTNQFLCRFGAIADNAPSCPYGACANSSCSKCDPWKKM